MTDRPTPAQLWESRYSGDTYLYGTEPNEFLRERAAGLHPGDALCLAEGEGRNAVYLAASGWNVSSVDLTQAGVAKTHRLAAANGVVVDASAGDLADFDLGVDRWDLIVSIFAHTAPTVRRDVHRRVAQALRPGGTLLLEAYTPAQIGRGTGGPQSAEMTMQLADLQVELAPLEILHGAELERLVVEGPGHTGLGAVVQVVARKR